MGGNTRRPQLESINVGHEHNKTDGFLGFYDGILCFGGEDWWYHNHAHFDMQIMQCMAQRFPVLYVNSLGLRMPSVREGRVFVYRLGHKLRSVAHLIRSPFAGFYVASPFSVPLWHWPLLAKLNVFSLAVQIREACRFAGLKQPLLWVANPTACDIVKRMKGEAFLVYQRTDKYEEYSEQTREYILAAHRWLLERANLVIYASRALYEEEQERSRQSLLIGHAVELDRFNPDKAQQAGLPPELVDVKGPIVGFFGSIDEDTVDMELVGVVVRALPEVSFVFVGELLANTDPVRGLPNIHFVGKKPYEEVPRYGVQFDVAIMPWKQNRWIHYCNPIKLKEYLALGLPVVSTEFAEAFYYQDVIYIARDSEDFVRGIREALARRGVGSVESRRKRVDGDTWEQATLRIAETVRKLADYSATK